MTVKIWKQDPSDIQGIYDFMINNPQVQKVRISYAYFAWGDAEKIGGETYKQEIVLVRRRYKSEYQANYWGFRFSRLEKPEIKPTVQSN